jgi:rhodanese-related sulfurtransferase
MLASQGYKTVNLQDGMIGWARAGLPIRRGMAK